MLIPLVFHELLTSKLKSAKHPETFLSQCTYLYCLKKAGNYGINFCTRKRLYSVHCHYVLYQKHQVTEVIIVGVYVDDFPVAASPADLVGDFFDAMGKLSIKYLVKVWKFLGMRAELSGEDGYMLNQQAAIEELPQQHGLWTRTACVPNAT